MPDWSYHTILRPALFRLPPEKARDLTLSASRTLASVPLGPSLIDLMGHMQPPQSIQVSALGMTFSGPVGLGAGLDVEATAARAFSRFGFGFLEVGPVTLEPVQGNEPAERRLEQNAICYPDAPVNLGLAALMATLTRHGPLPIPLGIRLGYQPGLGAVQAAHERIQLIRALESRADFFTLECQTELADGLWDAAQWDEHLRLIRAAQPSRPVLIALKPDISEDRALLLIRTALAHGFSGVVVSGGIRTASGQRLVGPPAREASLHMIRTLRAEFGDQITIIGSGGIHSPQKALEFLAAGATLIQIHSGFVYAGPGLPKRINEAVAYYCVDKSLEVPRPLGEGLRVRASHPALPNIPAWVWYALLGAMLVISGAIVAVVALTQTVLPYDEAFVGLSRTELMSINPRLIPFMTHDRATVAGTMLSTGILYLGAALWGIRRCSHWAKQAVSISAVSGFLNFFLFLGFGYFDPLHAVLTVGLLPLFLLGLRAKLPVLSPTVPPNLTNNPKWLTGQWGQLLFITIGAGLIGAGVAIASVGVTQVFVPEDLAFMGTNAATLSAANARLLPLIAHDRAGFGGNLISVGLCVLLLSLWGIRQGERWVWWTLLLAGTPGFVAGIGIHLQVGYTDLWHLSPAFLGLVFFVVGLALLYPLLWKAEKRVEFTPPPAPPRTAERGDHVMITER